MRMEINRPAVSRAFASVACDGRKRKYLQWGTACPSGLESTRRIDNNRLWPVGGNRQFLATVPIVPDLCQYRLTEEGAAADCDGSGAIAFGSALPIVNSDPTLTTHRPHHNRAANEPDSDGSCRKEGVLPVESIDDRP
jgi:hypothetical protein